MIKTFRGKLADGGQERFRLNTIKGKVGYKIVKFQTIGPAPGATGLESVVKIYKTEQDSVDGAVDFTDSSLLAVCTYARHEDVLSSGENELFIFDKEIFNQDIYITAFDTIGSTDTNYYVELEIIPLSDSAAEYSTLKDLRGYTKLNPFV